MLGKTQHGFCSHSAYDLVESNFVFNDDCNSTNISRINIMMWVAMVFDRYVHDVKQVPSSF